MPQRLGQHFLVQTEALGRIAEAACGSGADTVVEIGSGKGALTACLLARARRVVAIEIDGKLVRHMREKFSGQPKLILVHADVLDVDLTQWTPSVIAGNLPYYISSPILDRVISLDPPVSSSVFLMQKEVAQRVTAPPGSRDYGYLSARIQLQADAEVLFEVEPAAFRPPPKVYSAAVRLRHRNRAGELGIADAKSFLAFVGQCFRQKRKTIRNNLAGIYPKETLDRLRVTQLRAEQLSLAEFAALHRALVLA